MKKIFFKWIAIALLGLAVSPNSASGDQFALNLSNGSVITVEADADQIIPWNTVDTSGNSKEEHQRLGDIQRINLTDQPASLKVAKVRRLLDQLDSDSYPERQQAQAALSEPALGLAFRELIEQESENESLEVRTRVRLILASLKKAKNPKPPEFDILFLKDGTSLRGDVGEFVFKCSYRGTELNLERQAIRRLSPQAIKALNPQAAAPLAVETIHKHQAEFYADPKRVIDFDSLEDTDDTTSKDLTNSFIDRGIIMNADGKGFVGLSGYPFKYPDTPCGGESACVVDASGLYRKRFEGNMQFSFCQPGLPDIPAGVNEFGLFLSRVDRARDFIMEAYNQESQLLATTEATDEHCVFLGVRSNEPIAFVRVLSNPYLFEVDRKVDKNYAIDNLWFSAPQPLHDVLVARNVPDTHTICLKNGEILSVEDLRFKGETIQIFDSILGKQFVLETDEIHAIRYVPQEPSENLLRMPIPTSDDWMVMLKDRSILKVTPGKTFTSQLLKDRQLETENVMAIWSQRDHLRFPEKGDFADAKNILVFPTCRWQTEIELKESGVEWKTGKQIQQPVYPRLKRQEIAEKKELPENREDVTPKFTRFQYGKRTESQMPTIWLSQPQIYPSELGCVSLNDGQQISVGGEGGFSIAALSVNGVTLSGPDQLSIEIPAEQIHSIRFPN